MTFSKYLKWPLSNEAAAFWLTFVAGAISGVALVLAYASPIKAQIDWSFKFVELASAVGTVAAAVTATWLGLSAARSEERRAKESALLVAAALLPKLKLAASDVRTAGLELEFSEKPQDGLDIDRIKSIQESDFGLANSVVRNTVFSLSTDTVRDLTHLPNNAAHRLMMGIAYLENIRSTHFGEGGERRWNRYDPVVRYRILASIGARLSKADEYLKLSIVEMEKAVSDAGIEPTPEELYGDIGA